MGRGTLACLVGLSLPKYLYVSVFEDNLTMKIWLFSYR